MWPAREQFSFLSIQFNGKELFPTKEKFQELANALRQLDWTFKTRVTVRKKIKGAQYECLSDIQRKFSGVNTCESFFTNVYKDRERITV